MQLQTAYKTSSVITAHLRQLEKVVEGGEYCWRSGERGAGNGESYWRVIDSKDTFVEVLRVYTLRIRIADYAYASLRIRTVVAGTVCLCVCVFTYLAT